MTVWKCQTAHFVSLFHAAAHNPVCLPGHHLPLQKCIAHSGNADSMGLSGWKKILLPPNIYCFYNGQQRTKEKKPMKIKKWTLCANTAGAVPGDSPARRPRAPGCAAGSLSFLIMSLKNAAMIHGKKNTQGSGSWICWKQK